jgi:hypothetical protein|nr:MAG TPA: hypothetical protein [Caudoviricetes sp.]
MYILTKKSQRMELVLVEEVQVVQVHYMNVPMYLEMVIK